MSYKQLIVFEESGQFESEFIVHSAIVFSGYGSFLVGDVFPGSSPSSVDAKDIFVFSHGVDGRSHAIVKKRVIFSEVDDIENVLLIYDHALDREVEPLIVSDRINVITHDQIVLVVSDLL